MTGTRSTRRRWPPARAALCAPSLAVVLACLPAPPPPPAAPPADDEPDPPQGPAGCDGVTFAGSCDGDVLSYCSYGSVVEVDCGAVDDEVAFTCAALDPAYGSDCAVPVGAPCLDEVHGPAFCATVDGACVRGPAGASCGSGHARCTALDERLCLGELLVVECNVMQPYLLDCPAFGTTCAEGACVGIAEGEPCDPALLRCADGLACELGACVSLDAGVAPDAAALDGG